MPGEPIEGLRVLELYSGIGGMHCALRESGIPFEVVMAVDINTTANAIYHHNFPDVNLNSFGIEKLTLKKLRSLRPNAILMSPPCQPFSRVGKKEDCDDVRTKSFLHVLQLLQQMDEKPGYILVENVKGFEVSRTRQLLVDALLACCYGYQEYLLTPLQFGIPNSRLRYYLIAKLKSLSNPLLEASEILFTLLDPSTCKTQHSQNCTPNDGMPISSPQACHHSNHLRMGGDSTSSNLDGITTNCNKITTCQSYSSDISKNESHSKHCDMSSASSQDTTQRCIKSVTTSDNETGSGCEKPPIVDGETVERASDVLLSGTSDETVEGVPFSELMDAGRNMRYCEEEDDLINENSQRLSNYMENGNGEKEFEHLLVPDKGLRQFVVMDVVLPQLKKCTCFTKRYGHYVEGAGSLVQMSTSVQDTLAASRFKSKAVELKNKHNWGEEELSILRRLKLRYFSAREVANLLCFPKDFGFPSGLSDIQKYRCLGNSLNVHVVARLLAYLTADDFR